MAQDALVRTLPVVPVTVPGQGLAELIKRIPITVRANRVSFGDTTAVNLIELPGGIIVQGARIDITAAFDASGTSAAATATLTVPGSTGAVVLWDAANVALQTLTSDQMLPSTHAGWVKVPDSGGFAILNLTPGTTTVGSLEVYLNYLPDASKL